MCVASLIIPAKHLKSGIYAKKSRLHDGEPIIPSEAYEVDWSRIDAEIDSGRFIRWVDDPAWRWLGLAAEELLHSGKAQCPICSDLRPPRGTCPYCLRTGPSSVLPLRHPTPHISHVAEIRFRAKVAKKRIKG